MQATIKQVINWSALGPTMQNVAIADYVLGLNVFVSSTLAFLVDDNGKYQDVVPDFVSNMTAAWDVVQAMKQSPVAMAFAWELQNLFPATETEALEPWIYHVTPERIGIAALRARGYEVIL